jgi:Ion channel
VHRLHYHFGAVLGLILLSITYQLASPETDVATVIAVGLQSITLIAAVIASRAHAWVIRLTVVASLLLFIAASIALLGSHEFGDDSARVASLLMVGLAPAALITGMIKQFRIEERVTMQTAFGVLCLYLLVGLFFGNAFATYQGLSNDAFFASGLFGDSSDFLYYSFATLTTVGYGDLVAASDVGRSLSITEALIGQIYLVTVVAVIVSNLGPAGRRRTG